MYQYFLDFDLQVFSRPWPEYQLYAKQIRKEYFFLPQRIYNRGRIKILQNFLTRENIYHTELFKKERERQA